MAEETFTGNVCHWCARKCTCAGPCLGFNGCSLLNLDPIGLRCWPCANRDCPPHNDYVHKLFRTTLGVDKNMTDLITQFAYPVCDEPFTHACYKCEPSWEGYNCSVCKRLAAGGRPFWEFLATTTTHLIWRRSTPRPRGHHSSNIQSGRYPTVFLQLPAHEVRQMASLGSGETVGGMSEARG